MDLGCNMFTYNLNRRKRGRYHRFPVTTTNNNIALYGNNIYLATRGARLPAALGRTMYSKPQGEGCGCGK